MERFGSIRNWLIDPDYAYRFGLILILSVYVVIFGWMLGRSDLLPYVTDNNETFSVLWHSFNLFNFDFNIAYGLTDEAANPSVAAHPFAHTHQGNWPRIFGVLIYALGARTAESQILVTTASVGVAAVFFCYHFLAKAIDPWLATLFCILLMTDYVLYSQWHVVTYRVWHLFFLFSSLICVQAIGEGRRGFWAVMTILNYAALFYYEMIFVAFATGIAGLYAIALYRRKWKTLVVSVGCQITGAVLAISVLLMQLLAYYGFENLKKDIWFTFFARNMASQDPDLLQKLAAFYNEHNIAFWYNIEDGSAYLKPLVFLKSIFSFDFQVHTPAFTLLMLAMALPVIGLVFRPLQTENGLGNPGRRFALNASLITFPALVAIAIYALSRDANGIALVSGILSAGSFLIISFRLRHLNIIGRMPPGQFRVLDRGLGTLIVIAFSILALSLMSQDTTTGLPAETGWLSGRSGWEFLAAALSGLLALALIIGFLREGKVRSGLFEPGETMATAALVLFLAVLVRYQHWLYNQEFQLLWMNLYDNALPMGIVKITIFAATLLGAVLLVSGTDTFGDAYWKPARQFLVFLACGFLAYLVVYTLSPGYIYSGYLNRSTPFTVFLTNGVLAIAVYGMLRFTWFAIAAPDRRRGTWLLLGGLASGLVVMIAIFQWAAIQQRYVQLLPPNHFAFFKDLARDPYSGKSFAVGNYAAPIAAYTGQWSYMDFKMANGAYRETEMGIEVDRDERYLWMADRNDNPEYQTPDYYMCLSNQSLTTVVRQIQNKNRDVSSALGCDRMVKSFAMRAEEVTQRLKHKVVAFDKAGKASRGWMSWAIVKLDWHFPPILRKAENGSAVRPVGVNVVRDMDRFRLDYDYRYVHQSGEPEEGTVVELLRFGDTAECTNKPSRVTALETRQSAGRGSFQLPKGADGKYGVRVMPVSRNKSSERWYYSSAIAISQVTAAAATTCPIDILAEPPQTLNAAPADKLEIELKWTQVIDTAQYEIEIAQPGQDWKRIVSASPLQTRHVIRGLAPSTDYRFRIRPCDLGHVCGPYSPETTPMKAAP